MLVNGTWNENWQPIQSKDEQGRFVRQTSAFRNWITADGKPGPTGKGGYKAEKDRYHLYVAYICPWASRALMTRELKGLQNYISFSVVTPQLTDQGWMFGDHDASESSKLKELAYMHELYTLVDSTYTGRATVPVLWDKKTETIVNNESSDIVRMLNSGFSALVELGPDLYPEHLRSEIDSLNAYLYDKLNNGVYKAGFASTQHAYQEAYDGVFEALDTMEAQLSDSRDFLLGEALTETDLHLFVTLIRFDAAYHSLFKCNRNTLKEMPFLYKYMHRILKLDGISNTVNMEHIKAGYYSIKSLNPNGIVPKGNGTL